MVIGHAQFHQSSLRGVLSAISKQPILSPQALMINTPRCEIISFIRGISVTDSDEGCIAMVSAT